MSKEQQRAQDVLDDLLEVDDGLSNNEIEFLEDMNTKRHLIWTEKQIGWLDKIYERVVR